jgi:alanine racemase
MGRLGIPASPIKHTLDTLEKCLLLPHLEFEGIYSHFANANYLEDSKTQEQIAYFENILEKLDHPFSLVHLSNSDGIQNFPHSYGSPYNMVRTGINLYGVFDLEGEKNIQLKPTLSLHSKLIAKRQLPAGATIGYGGTHVLSKETWVGTIPAGYADGVPMEVGNKGQVLVKGHFCPIIGKVSMDYITIDLSLYPEAEIGEDVILIGRAENTEEITVEDWARLKGSHPYDVICSLGKRVERIYL